MREFCRISFVYEAKVTPIGVGFGVLSWLTCPLVVRIAYAPWSAGLLDTVSYLLICMLPLFCAKLANSIFVDLTSYKNLMISKNKILDVMDEPEETGSTEPFQTTAHEIRFEDVVFSYVPGELVLKHISFTVPDQKMQIRFWLCRTVRLWNLVHMMSFWQEAENIRLCGMQSRRFLFKGEVAVSCA